MTTAGIARACNREHAGRASSGLTSSLVLFSMSSILEPPWSSLLTTA